jgi:LysR family transcriptional regulator for bpeEF and oprC
MAKAPHLAATRDLFDGAVSFVAVAEELSFTKAARRLGVSTAAVSKAVLTLEARLGVPLLVRSTRSVALTHEGARYAARAREAVGALEAGRDEVLAARAPQGTVRVSLPPVLVAPVTDSLPAFLARHPRVDVALDVTNALARFPADGVDVGVRMGPLAWSSLMARPAGALRWLCVCAPSLAARLPRIKTIADLDDVDAVAFVGPEGKVRPWALRVDDRSVDVVPRAVRLRVNDGRALVDAARAGIGVVHLASYMVQSALADGSLVEVCPQWAGPGPAVTLVGARERWRAPAVRAFVQHAATVLPRALL